MVAPLATTLGAAKPEPGNGPAVTASWRVANTALQEIGQEVPDELVNNGSTEVVRGSASLARLAGSSWSSTFGSREQKKQAGARRDRCFVATMGSLGMRQLVGLQEAADASRPRDLAKWRAWPRSGPRVVTDLVQSVLMLQVPQCRHRIVKPASGVGRRLGAQSDVHDVGVPDQLRMPRCDEHSGGADNFAR